MVMSNTRGRGGTGPIKTDKGTSGYGVSPQLTCAPQASYPVPKTPRK
jgi:hypothetical protein